MQVQEIQIKFSITFHGGEETSDDLNRLVTTEYRGFQISFDPRHPYFEEENSMIYSFVYQIMASIDVAMSSKFRMSDDSDFLENELSGQIGGVDFSVVLLPR